MTETERYVRKLTELQEGERSRLRRLAGMPLDETLPGFDLFTGLWWPLRQASPQAPRRDTSWLVAKLYGAFPVPHVGQADGGNMLAQALGSLEPGPHPPERQERFRGRFDAILCSPLSQVEAHLRWGLSVLSEAAASHQGAGLDWVQLLEDLSVWDRANQHRRRIDVREEWAMKYLISAKR